MSFRVDIGAVAAYKATMKIVRDTALTGFIIGAVLVALIGLIIYGRLISSETGPCYCVCAVSTETAVGIYWGDAPPDGLGRVVLLAR